MLMDEVSFAQRFKEVEKLLQVARDSKSYYAKDLLRRLDLVLTDKDYRKLFFEHIEEDSLRQWLDHPPISNSLVETLQAKRWLPKTATLNALETRIDLEKVVQEIRGGEFDRENELHLELEYSRYLFDGVSDRMSVWRSKSWDQFKQLPWVEGKEVVLDEYDDINIEHTAQEAITVFNRIAEWKRDCPLLVIGNVRYGSDFVIRPIEERLTALGVKVAYERVCSTDQSINRHDVGFLSRETWEYIATKQPIIFIVDGTIRSSVVEEISKEKLTRFPEAFLGYIRAFDIYNKIADPQLGDLHPSYHTRAKMLRALGTLLPYHYDFWSPIMTPSFVIGSELYHEDDNNIPLECEQRNLIFVNSTASAEGYSHAAFDDPEIYIKGKIRLGFTSRGVAAVPIASTLHTFVNTVQKKLKRELQQNWIDHLL